MNNIDYPQIKNGLLSRLRSGEYTMVEFMKEVSFWALLHGFDEINPKPLPTKTDDIINFENRFHQMSELQKQNFDGMKYYADNPSVKSYYEQLSMIKNMNKSNYEWLQEIKKHIPVEDEVHHNKIEDRISRFKYAQDNEPRFI